MSTDTATATASATALVAALGRPDPTPVETVRLTTGHMADQRERLGPLADPVPRWLGPELYRHALDPDRAAGLRRDPAAARRVLARNTAPGTPLWAAGPGPGQPWVTDLVAAMHRDVTAVDPGAAVRAATPAEAAACLDLLGTARATLREVWPGAAAETDLLVRCVVPVRSADYRSGCAFEYFGAVVVSIDSLTSTEAAVEFLLHETGHLVHHVKSLFTRYVDNGADLVRHPLRTDPRPVSGTLHAAYSLYRMVAGLARMGASGHGSAEQRERLATHRTNLTHTVRTLASGAHWTASGQELFSRMCIESGGFPSGYAE